jgi:hypothetical protein
MNVGRDQRRRRGDRPMCGDRAGDREGTRGREDWRAGTSGGTKERFLECLDLLLQRGVFGLC